MKTNYIFRLDDIAPNMNWDMMSKVKKLFNDHNVKPILGVIPKNEDKELKLYPLCAFNFWNWSVAPYVLISYIQWLL